MYLASPVCILQLIIIPHIPCIYIDSHKEQPTPLFHQSSRNRRACTQPYRDGVVVVVVFTEGFWGSLVYIYMAAEDQSFFSREQDDRKGQHHETFTSAYVPACISTHYMHSKWILDHNFAPPP